MMYATSLKFLLHFGLKSLADLPRLGDFGEGNLEALALARLEPPELPASGGLFDGLDDLPGTAEDSMTGLEEAPHD
jgi:hypothetical protein